MVPDDLKVSSLGIVGGAFFAVDSAEIADGDIAGIFISLDVG